MPCLLKKKYKCNWFYLTDLTDNLETIHVQVWESLIYSRGRGVSSHICCSYKIFLSHVIFIFPLFQLHYTIPKNKRKTEITWDKKLTTTYKSNSKREFLPPDFLSKRTVLSCFYLLIFYLKKFSTWVWHLPIMLQVKFDFRLNLFNLGMLILNFPNYSWITARKQRKLRINLG